MTSKREAPTTSIETDGGDRAPSTPGTDDEWTFEVQSHYDPTESGDLTAAIVGAIADAEAVPITELLSPPLYAVVDTAELEKVLFGSRGGSESEGDSSVEFRYNEYRVHVEADGWVTVSKQNTGKPTD